MFTTIQKWLPQLTLSRVVGWLANANVPLVKNWAISIFIKKYRVNMSLAKEPDYRRYQSFNDFFTRELKEDARPIADGASTLISPVDGVISEFGHIDQGRLLQAKGAYYDVTKLLGDNAELAKQFSDGEFFTAYLSPRDYHRMHMPLAGTLLEMTYVPGRLFAVNPPSVTHVPQLFARNERVVNIFQTEVGKVAVIFVGAMIVGSIATKWHGVVTPPRQKTIQTWSYPDQHLQYQRGDEIGYFKLGSTVIMLFENGRVKWDEQLTSLDSIKMGMSIGEMLPV